MSSIAKTSNPSLQGTLRDEAAQAAHFYVSQQELRAVSISLAASTSNPEVRIREVVVEVAHRVNIL